MHKSLINREIKQDHVDTFKMKLVRNISTICFEERDI